MLREELDGEAGVVLRDCGLTIYGCIVLSFSVFACSFTSFRTNDISFHSLTSFPTVT